MHSLQILGNLNISSLLIFTLFSLVLMILLPPNFIPYFWLHIKISSQNHGNETDVEKVR